MAFYYLLLLSPTAIDELRTPARSVPSDSGRNQKEISQFIVAGYVVMPEHFHLLIGEPKIKNPSVVMQVLKQRVSLRCRKKKRQPKQQLTLLVSDLPPAFWQPRSYDFNVGTRRKYIQKLKYIHYNPVKRGLVSSPELWRWSSFRFYWYGEEGPVKIGE